MQKIHFSIFIHAPKEKVWDTMLSDDTYRQWTSSFNPGSYYKGSWEEGSKILFLGPGAGGEGESGMYSIVRENRTYEFLSLQHQGIIKNGIEDTTSDESKKWTGAYENYIFIEKDGGTELSVDMDVEDEHKPVLEEMWPKALQALKELAER